jgi:hypothetical protein
MQNDHDQERRISHLAADENLARVDGIGALHALPVDELVMRAEEGEGESGDEMEGRIRSETLSRMLEFLFEDGGGRAHVYRRVWLLAKNVRPEILRRHRIESLESGAAQLECTRAALCAANKRIIVRLVEVAERRSGRAHGSYKAGFQKSATNVQKLSAAQKRSQGKNGANRSAARRKESITTRKEQRS